MAKYPFLSSEWIDAAKALRDEAGSEASVMPGSVKMNLVITEVPFGEGNIDAHMDTSGGQMEMDLGHMEDAELKVTLDYPTAKAILIEGNPQAGMQAFMAGKIKVEGDMAKLMAMQTATPDAAGLEMAGKLRDITE
ncbi:MAG: SCP-2 sterol transfer family protein [Acidimicrobiales bacterium]|nr:SCP-2 sterol transfer family protein [Acidimicrobiales bacterium]